MKWRRFGAARTRRDFASVCIWLICIAGLELILMRYAFTAGVHSEAPVDFPKVLNQFQHPGRGTLIMFVHPHCPCSKASIEELSRLMTGFAGEVDAYVVFVRPRGVAQGWEHTAAWLQASVIPGVKVVGDEQGQIAACFHAATSGTTFFYDGRGHLIFNGGITPARGLEGDTIGGDYLRKAVHSQGRTTDCTDLKCTAVFGCALFDPANGRPIQLND